MAYERDVTAADQVFFDTDKRLVFTAYQGNPTAAEIAAETAVPQDVSGYEFSWTLRKTAKAADPLIRKTTGDGITIEGTYNATPASNTQRIVVTLSDKDTYDPDADPPVLVKEGDYVHALKRTDDGSETVYTFGRFKLLRSAAWE